MTRFRLLFMFMAVMASGALPYSCLKMPADEAEEMQSSKYLTLDEAQYLFRQARPKTYYCGGYVSPLPSGFSPGRDGVEYLVNESPRVDMEGKRAGIIPVDFTPDWEAAEFRMLSHGSSITVPIKTSHRVFAIRDSLPGRPHEGSYVVGVSQVLVVVKGAEDGNSSVYIQSVVPDMEYYLAHKADGCFDVRDEDFSGFEIMCLLAGQPVYVYAYSGGRLLGRVLLYNGRDYDYRYKIMAIRRMVGRTAVFATPVARYAGQ